MDDHLPDVIIVAADTAGEYDRAGKGDFSVDIASLDNGAGSVMAT